MTDAEIEEARRFAVETRAEQGLPPTIEDPGTLAKVLALMNPAGRSREPAA